MPLHCSPPLFFSDKMSAVTLIIVHCMKYFFSSSDFRILSLLFRFQQYDYDKARYGFLFIYFPWISLNLSGPYVDILHQFWKIVTHYLFWYYFSVLLLFLWWDSRYTNVSLFNIVSRLLDVLITLLLKIFSLCVLNWVILVSIFNPNSLIHVICSLC